MKKILIIYNPRSSQHAAIEQEVLAPARQLNGWMVGKYAIKPTNYNDNVEQVARLVSDGDLIIVAGGDGTVSIAINGVLQSSRDVAIGVLSFGNFNDVAHMLNSCRSVGATTAFEKLVSGYCAGSLQMIYPLDVSVNGQHWRYAPCYFTVGLLAQSTTVMESEKVRKKLRAGHTGTLSSLIAAVKWYLKNYRQNFLPAGSLNDSPMPKKTTDYIAVNGPHVARIMKGGTWYQDARKFGSMVARLGRFWQMVRFGLRSIASGLELQETEQDIIKFDTPNTVEMHAEGEFERAENVEKIEVKKAERALKIVVSE